MANDGDNKAENSGCGSGAGSCCSGSGKWIWIGLLVAVAGVLIARTAGRKNAVAGAPAGQATPAVVETVGAKPATAEPAAEGTAIPRLVDLGATKCIPCKMMAPILEELKKSYAGKLDVTFIDVWENPDAGKKYGINLIPTQIFFGADGRELFRHEGFFARDDILAKWKELGVELMQKPETMRPNAE